MIRTSGVKDSVAATTSDNLVSDKIYKEWGETPIRSARILSCRSLSSPETYNTFLFLQRLLQI